MPQVDPQLISQSSELWEQSRDHENLLHFLRASGVSKFDSIKVVREVCGISLGEAKRVVTLSAEWRDTLEATAELHDAITSSITGGDRS
jgi:ribosomal protein L7/L12